MGVAVNPAVGNTTGSNGPYGGGLAASGDAGEVIGVVEAGERRSAD